MKIDRLEAHDRLQHLKQEQSKTVFQGAEDCLKRNPLSLSIQEKSPYLYLFAHPRTADDGFNKRLFWQPRLSRPDPQTNSYLFRAISKTDIIEVCWLIPARELWPQFNIGNVTQSELVNWSIAQFRYHFDDLKKNHPEDMPESEGRIIMKAIIDEHLAEVRHAKYN